MKHDLRREYEAAAADLRRAGRGMLDAGLSEEYVARWMVDRRNDLRRKYRELTPAEVVRVLESHSVSRYGNSLGPSADQLRATGKSWADIIESAARAGEMPQA